MDSNSIAKLKKNVVKGRRGPLRGIEMTHLLGIAHANNQLRVRVCLHYSTVINHTAKLVRYSHQYLQHTILSC